MAWIWVALGGALGSLLRYLAVSRLNSPNPGDFPTGTLAVNLAGSAAIGLLWAWLDGSGLPPRAAGEARAFLLAGLLGGFTTFSAFSLENALLLRAGEWRLALGYVLLSNALGIGLALAGFQGMRMILRAA